MSSRTKITALRLSCFLPLPLVLTVCSPNWAEDSKSAPASPRAEQSEVETTTLNFDELPADNVVGNAVGRCAVDVYRKLGLLIGTCDLTGVPAVGKTIRLTNPVAGFEVMGGHDQPYLSPYNFVIAAGGGTHDVLLTFEEPVTSVSVMSDRFRERGEVIRLMILEPIEVPDKASKGRPGPPRHADFRVLAGVEKLDNAQVAPDNVLAVDLKGQEFQYVLFECTTEQEGFDNLRFTRKKPAKIGAETPVSSEDTTGRDSQKLRKPLTE